MYDFKKYATLCNIFITKKYYREKERKSLKNNDPSKKKMTKY